MADSDRSRWEAKHAAGTHEETQPAAVLLEYAHLLPERGLALDLACGRGANALFLARRRLETVAWDISTIAVESVLDAARRAGLSLRAEQRDVVQQPPAPRSFDVIVVSRFLDRALVPALITALRPRGLIFYQTFRRDAPGTEGPRRPEYRLEPGELLRLFAPLGPLAHHERGSPGGAAVNEAMLVARQTGTD